MTTQVVILRAASSIAASLARLKNARMAFLNGQLVEEAGMASIASNQKNWPLVAVVVAIALFMLLAFLSSRRGGEDLPRRNVEHGLNQVNRQALPPHSAWNRNSGSPSSRQSLEIPATTVNPSQADGPLGDAGWIDDGRYDGFRAFVESQPNWEMDVESGISSAHRPAAEEVELLPECEPAADVGLTASAQVGPLAAMVPPPSTVGQLVANRCWRAAPGSSQTASEGKGGTSQMDQRELAWPIPWSFLDRLDELATECDCAEWVEQTRRLVWAVVRHGGNEPRGLAGRLEDLHRSVARARSLAALANPSDCRDRLRVAAERLQRLLLLWDAVAEWDRELERQELSAGLDRLGKVLPEIDALFATSLEGEPWDEYLMLGTLRGMVHDAPLWSRIKRARVARQVLARMTSTRLAPEQVTMLRRGALRELRLALESLAAEGLTGFAILTYVERYEQNPSLEERRDLLGCQRALEATGMHSAATLASILRDYRLEVAARRGKLPPSTAISARAVHSIQPPPKR